MAFHRGVLSLVLAVCFFICVLLLPRVASQHKCQRLKINLCKGLNYDRALFPNFENHRTQEMAALTVNHFNPLFKVGCSADLKYFVCSYYAPVCNTLGRLIKPCKSLCESARKGCHTVMKRFGYDWPSQLDCNKFPADPMQEICVGQNHSRTTPVGPKKPPPTQTLTATTMKQVAMPPTASKHKCRKLKINSCKGLDYDRTLFPNFENHRGQKKAARMINHFNPLFKAGCSPDLKYFVCSYYAPMCNTLGRPVKPCKSLCESARRSCRTAMERFGYNWSAQLDCNKFPDDQGREICIGRNNSRTSPAGSKQLPPTRIVASKTINNVPVLPRLTVRHKCQALHIDSCKGLNYNETIFPNFVNHRTQGMAAQMINHFRPLFKVGCSPDLKYFVCSYYAPVCNTLGRLIKPCKSLCESARKSCHTVMERFGYDWPAQLDCNKFPADPTQQICVGQNNSKTTPAGPKQLPPTRIVASKTINNVPVLPRVTVRHKCQALHIDSCKGLNYNETIFPNFVNHRTQGMAAQMINHFRPLFKFGCSPDLKYFVCSYYAPVCNTLGRLIKPCKSLCETVRKSCRTFMKRLGYDWPSQLDCNKFPADPTQQICVGQNNSKTTPAGPKQPSPTRIVATKTMKQVPVLPKVTVQHKCQALHINSCKELNYNLTMFPNFENHRSQGVTAQLINNFNPLFKAGCSPDLKYLVCSYYAPVCNTLGRLIKPCKSLCESARKGCSTVMERFGYNWPAQLDCNKFPADDQNQEICVGRSNS